MDPDLIHKVSAEVSAFLAATNRKEFLIGRAEELFDEFVEPVDLPGPDAIFDPLLRAVIRPLVSRVYDQVVAKMEAQSNGE